MKDKPNIIVALGTWKNKLVHIPALTALRKAEVTHLFDQDDATPYELNKHWKHDNISGANTIRWLGESSPPPTLSASVTYEDAPTRDRQWIIAIIAATAGILSATLPRLLDKWMDRDAALLASYKRVSSLVGCPEDRPACLIDKRDALQSNTETMKKQLDKVDASCASTQHRLERYEDLSLQLKDENQCAHGQDDRDCVQSIVTRARQLAVRIGCKDPATESTCVAKALQLRSGS